MEKWKQLQEHFISISLVFTEIVHGGVSKMDASRNILFFNVTPIYGNERDFHLLLTAFNFDIFIIPFYWHFIYTAP